MFYCAACGALFGDLQQLALHQQSHYANAHLSYGKQLQYTPSAVPNLPIGVYPATPSPRQSNVQLLNGGALGAPIQADCMDNMALTRRLTASTVAGSGPGYILPAKDMYMNEQLTQMLINLRVPNNEVDRLQAELVRWRQQQHPQARVLSDLVSNGGNGADCDLSAASSFLLEPITYALAVDCIDGVDIQVPLEDVSIGLDVYHLLSGSEHNLLESVKKRQQSSVVIEKTGPAHLVLTLKDPLEFTVECPRELYVLIITFTSRDKILFWASLRAHKEGMWITALRRPPVDVSASLETAGNCLPKTMMCGTIQTSHSQDVLVTAERYLRSVDPSRVIPVKGGTRSRSPPQQKPKGASFTDSPAAGSRHGDTSPAELADDKDIPMNTTLVDRLLWKLRFDPNGVPIVPGNFKSSSASRSRLADVTQELKTEASVLLELRPDGALPPPEERPGHGPQNNEVAMSISFVTGLPLNAVCSRALVYLIDNIDPATGKVANNANNPAVLLRPPDVIQHSTFSEGVLFPTFNINMPEILITGKTHAIVIIEYVTANEGGPFVFGHTCFPIHQDSRRGNFISRIRLGDPRRPEARDIWSGVTLEEERGAMEQYSQEQIEDTLNSQALYNSLFGPPRKHFECCPCSYIMWSLDSDPELLYFDFPDEPPPTAAEKELYHMWQGVDPQTLPYVDSWEAVEEAFKGRARLMGNKINYIVPSTPGRGFYVDIESLHGMGTGHALYAVALYLGRDAPDKIMLTLSRDWFSDVSAPQFKEPMRMLTGVVCDSYLTFIPYVFKVSNLKSIAERGEGELKISAVGWTMIRVGLEEGVLRHGRYALPWFSGLPPPEMLKQLESEPIERVFSTWLGEDKIRFMESKSTVVVSISDAADVGQIIADHPGRPLPQKLFLPRDIKDSFPAGVYEGAVGYTQQQLVTALGLNVKDVERAVNARLTAYVCEKFAERA